MSSGESYEPAAEFLFGASRGAMSLSASPPAACDHAAAQPHEVEVSWSQGSWSARTAASSEAHGRQTAGLAAGDRRGRPCSRRGEFGGRRPSDRTKGPRARPRLNRSPKRAATLTGRERQGRRSRDRRRRPVRPPSSSHRWAGCRRKRHLPRRGDQVLTKPRSSSEIVLGRETLHTKYGIHFPEQCC